MAEELEDINNQQVDDPNTPFVKGVYQNLKQAFGEHNVPDEATFTQKMLNDRQYREGIRTNLIQAFGEHNVPSYDDFENKVVPKIAGMKTYPDRPVQPVKQNAGLSKFLPKQTEQRQRGDIVNLPGAMGGQQQDEQLQRQLQDQDEKYQQAAVNSTKLRFQKMGADVDENSKTFKDAVVSANQQRVQGTLAYTTGRDGQPYLTRPAGFLESLVGEAIHSGQSTIEGFKVNAINDPSKLADYFDEKNANEPIVPQSEAAGMGYFGKLLGGVVKPAALMSANALAYGMGTGAMTAEAYNTAMAAHKEELYYRGLREGLTRDQAAKKAMEVAPTEALPDAAMAYFMGKGASGVAQAAAKQEVAAQALKTVISKSLKSAAGVAAAGGVAEASKEAVAGAAGYDTNLNEVLSKGLEGVGTWGLMDLSFKLLHIAPQLPKYTVSAAKEYLSTVPKPLVESVAANLGEDGTAILDQLNGYQNARNQVEGLVPDEHLSSYAGVMERKANLNKEIQELETRKTPDNKPFHADIDAQIKEKQALLDAEDARLSKMKESGNPLSEEVDITGESLEPTKDNTSNVPRGTPETQDGGISKPIELSPEITNNEPVTENVTQLEGVKSEPPPVEGETVVTHSGLNEQERQALIDKRKRETKVTDKTLQANALLEQIDRYNDMAKGRLGKSAPEGLQLLNEINLKARELGYKFDQASGKLKSGRTSIKANLSAEGNRSIDEKGIVLRERPIEVQKAFNEATDAGAYMGLPTLKGDKRMSADQIDAAIEDIHNGIPSVGANRYLDAFEEALKKDQFLVRDAYGQEQGLSFSDFTNVKKEQVGEPLDEKAVTSWLSDQGKLTPEQEHIISDNIDNLIQEHDTGAEGRNTKEISKPTTTGERQSDKSAEPDNTNISSNQAKPAPAQSPGAQPISAAARKLAGKIREGKISKLGGFKSSTGFDAVWDGSLEIVATALEKGADIADAVEKGLEYIRNTDWYKNLSEKQDFEDKYREHFNEPRETGIKNEQTKQEREDRGLKEVEVLTKRQFGDVYERAKKYAEENPQYPLALAESLSKRPRPITPEESATLIYSRMKLQNEHGEVETRLSEALQNKDDGQATELLVRRAYLENNLEINDEAARRTGYEQGLGLAIRRMMIKEDYSMSRLITRARVAMGGNEVPEELRAKLESLSKELQAANEKALQYEESLKIKEQELKFAKTKIEAQAEVKRNIHVNKRTITKEVLQVERKALVDELRQIAKEQRGKLSVNPIPVEMIPVLAKLTKNLVQDGIVTLEGVVDHLYENIKDIVEGVTKRDVRDAISGYGKTTSLSKDEVNVQLREIKRQGRLVSAYEDAAGLNGEPRRPERSGFQRDEPSDKVRELEKQVKKALKDNGIEIDRKESDPVKAWKSALEAYKKRLTNQEADLQDKIDKGDFTKEKRKPLVLDKEALELKAKVGVLKDKIDYEIRKEEAKNRTGIEKSLDWFAKFRRGVLITGTSTLGKLQAAAMFRTIQTPIEEVIGGILSKVPGISKIAEKAPREGGFNAEALAKYYTSFFSKETFKESWTNKDAIIKTGKSKYDRAYGKKDKELPENNLVLKALEYYGNSHMALKYPAKKAEIEAAMVKRVAHAIKNGEDVTDPVVSARIWTEALVDGNRAIFSQDNAVTKQFQANIAMMRNRGLGGKLAATGAKILFPITKIPSNYLGEVASIIPGIGLAKAGLALTKGIEALTPQEADYVMRQFKKQGLGIGLLALGYMGAHSLGGFWRRDKDKKMNSVHPGDIEVFGEKIPHTFLHSPMIEIMQAGATYRQIADEYAKHGKEGAAGHGLYESGLGILKQSPFVNTPLQLAEALKGEKGLQKFSAELVRSVVLPPDVQKLARMLDPLPEGAKRKPHGFVDIVKLGVPGLREQVKTDLEELMDQRLHPNKKTPQEKFESRKQKFEREQERKALAKELGVQYIPPRR